MEPVYRAALALGTANQLTNILRDVGEDLETRNRIYVPLDELQRVSLGAGRVGGWVGGWVTCFDDIRTRSKGKQWGRNSGDRKGMGCLEPREGKPWAVGSCRGHSTLILPATVAINRAIS